MFNTVVLTETESAMDIPYTVRHGPFHSVHSYRKELNVFTFRKVLLVREPNRHTVRGKEMMVRAT